jgi:hypothetical protein
VSKSHLPCIRKEAAILSRRSSLKLGGLARRTGSMFSHFVDSGYCQTTEWETDPEPAPFTVIEPRAASNRGPCVYGIRIAGHAVHPRSLPQRRSAGTGLVAAFLQRRSAAGCGATSPADVSCRFTRSGSSRKPLASSASEPHRGPECQPLRLLLVSAEMFRQRIEVASLWGGGKPPNPSMELTGQNRHSLCKDEEQRERRFCPAAHASC